MQAGAEPSTRTAVTEVAPRVTEVASTAVYSIVKDSVFGALLIVAVIGIIWLIKRLLDVQDKRVADQVRANELMERTREKTAHLMEQMTKASSEVNSTLERLTDVQSDNVKALGELRAALQTLQMTMDSIIREAVRARHEHATPAPPPHVPALSGRHSVGGYSLSDPEKPGDERGRR